MADKLLPIPDDLLKDGTGIGAIHPPVQTRSQELPFGEITWQNFERLCARLLQKDSELRNIRRYGEQGNEQSGIDIFSFRAVSAKFTVCQCKNVASFGPADIRRSVSDFLAGEWAGKSDRFILAVRDNVNTKDRGDAIAEGTSSMGKLGITFEPWDGDILGMKLKAHRDVVADFFGEPWAAAFCGGNDPASAPRVPSVDSGRTGRERQRMVALIEGLTQ